MVIKVLFFYCRNVVVKPKIEFVIVLKLWFYLVKTHLLFIIFMEYCKFKC